MIPDVYAPPAVIVRDRAPARALTTAEADALVYVRATAAPKLILGGSIGGTALLAVALTVLQLAAGRVEAGVAARLAVYGPMFACAAGAVVTGVVGLAATRRRPGAIAAVFQLERAFWLSCAVATGFVWVVLLGAWARV